MESEDKEFEKHYHKAHHITEELLSAYQNNQSLNDQEEIDRFFRKNKSSKELIERLSSKHTHRLFYDRLNKEDKEKNIADLLGKIRQENQKKQTIKRITRYVASIAAVLTIIIFIWIKHREYSPVQLYSSIVEEQYTRPTLLLEDNRAFVLPDSSEALVNEDYGVEKLKGNNLKYNSNNPTGTTRFNKLIVPGKYTYTITFNDGTEVMLNAGSILRYPVDFVGDTREVELSGEAFFKVAKSDKPFIVRMDKKDIRVYGTQFNVNTRINGKLEIVLLEGSIGFTMEGKEEIRMKPNQMIVCDNLTNDIQRTEVQPGDYIMWTENMFVFRGQELGRVLSEVAVWYGIEITSGRNLEDIKLTLIANKNNTLEDIFKFIVEITNIKIIKKGDMEYKIE